MRQRPGGRVGEGLVVKTRGSRGLFDPYKTLWGSLTREKSGLVILGLFVSEEPCWLGAQNLASKEGFLKQEWVTWTKPNLGRRIDGSPGRGMYFVRLTLQVRWRFHGAWIQWNNKVQPGSGISIELPYDVRQSRPILWLYSKAAGRPGRSVLERQKGARRGAANPREWKETRVASSTKKNAGGQGRSCVGRRTRQNDDDNKRRWRTRWGKGGGV